MNLRVACWLIVEARSMVGLETSGSASGLAKTVSRREALSKFHCEVGRLGLRQNVGMLSGLSGVW